MYLLANILTAALFYLIAFGIMTSLEIFWRKGEMTVADRAAGLRFWAMLIGVQAVAGTLFVSIVSALEIKPLVTIHWTWGSAILAALAGGLGYDFVFYWYHRAQHRWFWRWHSVHHSIENLTAINSYHHWSEPFFSIVLISFPFALFDLQATPQLLSGVHHSAPSSLYSHRESPEPWTAWPCDHRQPLSPAAPFNRASSLQQQLRCRDDALGSLVRDRPSSHERPVA